MLKSLINRFGVLILAAVLIRRLDREAANKRRWALIWK